MSNNLTKTIYDEMRGEFVGTFILVFFGVGSVGVAVATGGYDLWGLSVMW
ncbi:aquaporin, partial [Candidatus Atribacteria bacterium 1244-E10-H5-B2]